MPRSHSRCWPWPTDPASRSWCSLWGLRRREAGSVTCTLPPHTGRRYLRGLFAGGTLAGEALRGLQTLLGPVLSNLGGSQPVGRPASPGHLLLDLGEGVFTVGRLH